MDLIRARIGFAVAVLNCGFVVLVGCGTLNEAGTEFGNSAGGNSSSSSGGASGGVNGIAGMPGQGGSSGNGAGGVGGVPNGSGGMIGAGGMAASGGMAATGGTAGSGGMAGGVAGIGGMAGMCVDQDMDGQTTCAGDCNDNDRNNFKGNPEACGDMADNNCDNNADEGCMGLGTFVSAGKGNDNNAGTRALPVRTIAKGMQNARTIGGGLAVYVADGVYREKVALFEGVALLGGHQCNPAACTWQRDSKQFISRIEATDAEGMLAGGTVTPATLVDGFDIVGLDGGASGQGRAAFTINGGAPTVTRNRIYGPQTRGGGYPAGRSLAIRIVAPVAHPQGALIDSNEIRGGSSESEGSVGLAMEGPVNNGPSRARIANNTIIGGRGRMSDGISAWSSGVGTLVEGNRIFAGTADSDSAFAVSFGGTLDINANLINTDPALVGNCMRTNHCGGIQSESGTGRITNNVVRGMNAPNSVGVILREAERAGGLIILNGNTIDGAGIPSGGGNGMVSRALVLWIGDCNSCGFNGQVGRIRNNILSGGMAGNRYGVHEESPSGKQQQPLAFENNLIYFPTAQGRTDVFYREWTGNTQRYHLNITQVNTALTIPSTLVGGNVAGDPLLDATWHLQMGSPAIDVGTATEAPPQDRDRETRPKGGTVDIGADER